eukprot:scaffold30319_cov67-Skeletonema_dohrnii-CCMP3373.AAC.1
MHNNADTEGNCDACKMESTSAKIAILELDLKDVPDRYDPKQAAAVPSYASCPLFPEDFQRIDVHSVEVYSTNFN